MYKILAIDGGGIRGVIPAKWLERLEDELGSPLADHFNIVAGTSTGSVLAAGVAAGIPAKRLLAFYQEFGATIFPPRGYSNKRKSWMNPFLKPKYDEGPLRDVLKSHFSDKGAVLLLKDLRTDCLIVTYDVLRRRPRILKSWDESEGDIPVWEACKASCSAPTYFPAHLLKFDDVECPLIDGGVVANNPASLAVAYAIKKQLRSNLTAFEATQRLLVVSMGTGNLTRPITVEQARQWGTAQWALPIIDVVFDGSSAADDLVCEAILKDDAYFRLQVDLKAASDDLDDASRENINELMADAMRYIDESDGRRQFESVVASLRQDAAESEA